MERRIPLVSVIVPVFNVEKYLGRCLDSLVGQTLRDIEIICVNDFSTDGSLTILQSYAKQDSRIKIINLPENRKQGGARNAGLREAQAPFVAFVDSDDWVDENMFLKLWTYADSEGLDIACSDYFAYHGDLDIRRCKNLPADVFNSDEDTRKRAFLLNDVRLWTNLYRKQLFFEYGLFFPEHLLYEDNAIVAALYLSARRIGKLNMPFYYYRCDNTSTTRSTNNYRYFDRLKTSKLFLEHMKRLGFYSRYPMEVEFRFVELFYVNTVMVALSQFNPPEESYIEKVTEEVRLLCPCFRESRYYKERIPLRIRAVLYLISCNTHFGIVAYQILKKLRH